MSDMMKWAEDKDAFGRQVYRAERDDVKLAILPTRTGYVLSADSVPVDSGRENGRFASLADAIVVAENYTSRWEA